MCMATAVTAATISEEMIQKSFYPYKDWTPTYAGSCGKARPAT